MDEDQGKAARREGHRKWLEQRLSQHHRKWTEKDDFILTCEWGNVDLLVLAHRLGRTTKAITLRAGRLKLERPLKTLADFTRSSGYSPSQIRTALETLGIKLAHARRTDPRQHRTTVWWSITEEQEEAVLKFLQERPDGQRLYRKTGGKTEKGVWGIGIKPAACSGCQSAEAPHYAKGLCRPCYDKKHPKKRRPKKARRLPRNELFDRVYDILCRHAGADEALREEFVRFCCTMRFLRDRNTHLAREFRFMGSLGLGGRIWLTRTAFYVNTYEHELTDERMRIIYETNQALSKIFQPWKNNGRYKSSGDSRAHEEGV